MVDIDIQFIDEAIHGYSIITADDLRREKEESCFDMVEYRAFRDEEEKRLKMRHKINVLLGRISTKKEKIENMAMEIKLLEAEVGKLKGVLNK